MAGLLHGPVKMRNSNNLSSDIVVESVHAVGVDKTVTNPQPRLDTFCHLYKDTIVHFHHDGYEANTSPMTSKASSMPSSDTFSGFSAAAATFSASYLKTRRMRIQVKTGISKYLSTK